MAYLELQNIIKRFGDVRVVEDISLSAAAGEFIVLVGASGCGKSTTLRMIAGLESPSSGRIVIDGRDVTAASPAHRDIAMVFQNYALYPHMDVAQNMSFALELARTPRAQIDSRVAEAARILGIEHLLRRKPKELSGGQRQRVAMGRAIVRDPKVFLFDEPLSNLDAKLRGQVRAEIKALSQQLKTTMVFVTHDQVEAMTMADRIVVLQSGTVQQYDTPEAVYERPSNQFVAGFIGSPTMNFFPVELRGEGVALSHDGTAVRLNGESRARLQNAGGRGVLGIRPEHFAVMPSASDGMPVAVKLVEPLGSDTLIHFDLAGASAIARVDPALRPRVGDRLALSPQPGKTHLFDAGNGQVLP
jgi:multiple sugar transport system ATP-binding protein